MRHCVRAPRSRRAVFRGHPRVRGEHRDGMSPPNDTLGPSPRARGAHFVGDAVLDDEGTIPACAESTPSAASSPPSARDHPRVRGEHLPRPRYWGVRAGPSPRARGARDIPVEVQPNGGTIPACAGSTSIALTAEDLPAGPSPRARGAPGELGGPVSGHGTIPACVGSTNAAPLLVSVAEDHPRVRGEHGSLAEPDRTNAGPSPRARGAPAGIDGQAQLGGTIPACAGSTRASRANARVLRDHPRVRGEHLNWLGVMFWPRGPSPRARGALATRAAHTPGQGTIPACAGSTPRYLRNGARGRGPSPRARGAPQSEGGCVGGVGTIPACAGSTTR